MKLMELLKAILYSVKNYLYNPHIIRKEEGKVEEYSSIVKILIELLLIMIQVVRYYMFEE